MRQTRQEKIRLLNNIHRGRLTLESLQPARTYFFLLRPDNIYEMDGKEYTPTEYKQLVEKIKKKNSKSLIWTEQKTYESDKIITFIPAEGCEPLLD